MRVLLLRTWIANMGNAFIDKGALISLKKAIPKSDIYEVSGYPNFLFAQNNPGLMSYHNKIGLCIRRSPNILARKIKNEHPFIQNCLNVGELINADVAVLPGCILYPHAIEIYKHTLDRIKTRGTDIVLLGVGGGDYEPATRKYVKKFLDKLKPLAVITRDSIAYNHYSKYAEMSYDGIDCGFFINNWYEPPEIEKPYVAFAFDGMVEPELGISEDIIRLHHTTFDSNEDFFKKENTLISDIPEDYLTIYANAKETHTDRVHACVASLAYGVPAKLYSDTPRANLFTKIIDEEITQGLVQVNVNNLEQAKNEQVNFLKDLF